MTDKSMTIEVRLLKLEQLFNSFDPSPFLERDLDKEAEDYIIDWARELPVNKPIRILVHLPPDEVTKGIGVDVAIARYFDYRAAQGNSHLKELFRNGRWCLSIGIPVLLICLFASQMVHTGLGDGPLSSAIEENLIIVGWVANWKPIQTFLYDWWPLKRRRDLYRRLAKADCEIVS
ncbi:MAG: hypothetical protein WBH28_24980 [Fuerstiella sp.]